ncbi:hypothetical protein GCM10027160_27250 [Streptomyces calidiresistens]|uniref:ATP-dependent DNA helicase n=1 Tax=Streptomyces calidiresistens TaxID=1485586 RepID=UPI002B1FB65A|nr:ATP-dependent DNA helicase [Streptomyces calidiresistens]
MELLGIPFTEEQLACITAPPEPQVIVAGAGSGKTTVMAARVVWLVGTGLVAPEQVLGLTFTNKAAAELGERVRTALRRAGVLPAPGSPAPVGSQEGDGEPHAGEPEISTYHAFAGRLLTEHGLRVGVEPSAHLLADASRFQLAAEALRAAGPGFVAPTGSSTGTTRGFPDLVRDLVALDGELSEHLVDPADLRALDTAVRAEIAALPRPNADLRRIAEAARGRTELLGPVEEYRSRKRARDLIDFGDQLALAARLARDVPAVGRALRDRFAVVLLDEYQDTSVAQRVMLSGLFGEGTGHAVTAVGDPCQAIYGWRGASVANLDEFPDHFPHRDGTPARRRSLTENRRSGGRLLRLANDLAAPLRERHPGVSPLRPAPDAEEEGRVRCALLPTHADELTWLADSIAHLVNTGTPPGEVAVLCRTAGDFPAIQRELVARSVPVEVVGLSGLLHLPEVADLVSVCRVLVDPTANADLVRILTGPRWRIGPRDLALLGRRARLLVHRERPDGEGPDHRLAAAVESTDPAETISLADALDTFVGGDRPGGPGSAGVEEPADDLPFSDEARIRFAHLAAELRELRRGVADPLMDVLHRVLTVTGLEIELSASPTALAARRRETLEAFLDTAASFAANGRRTAVDGDTHLPAFLAFLRAAEHYDKGLDGSLPGGEDTVKVLTAHKAKGLEWDVVALPGLYRKGFPQERGQDSWLRHSHVLPQPLRGDAATLPAVREWSAAALREHAEEERFHRELEELRLGYVAFTRPRSLLLGSAHRWGPEQKRPRVPSGFLLALRRHCEEHPAHGEVEAWAEEPAEDAVNPLLEAERGPGEWPLPLDPEATHRRREAARLVLAELRGSDGPPDGSPEDPPDGATGGPGTLPAPRPGADERGGPGDPDDTAELTPEERRLVASWDRDLGSLSEELRRARSRVREVPLPLSLSASQLQRLAADPEGFARELARPMPRPPRPAARRGTRFHAWVESRFDQVELPLLGDDEQPGGDPEEDPAIRDERELAALKEAFARTPWAHRTPHRVEAPFELRLAGRVIRGRIDAVYRTDDGWEIIDWKTGRDHSADPLQLAVYRVAWAERHDLPLSRVTAAFLYVRTGELVRPAVLPDRAGLEAILRGDASWALNVPG